MDKTQMQEFTAGELENIKRFQTCGESQTINAEDEQDFRQRHDTAVHTFVAILDRHRSFSKFDKAKKTLSTKFQGSLEETTRFLFSLCDQELKILTDGHSAVRIEAQDAKALNIGLKNFTRVDKPSGEADGAPLVWPFMGSIRQGTFPPIFLILHQLL